MLKKPTWLSLGIAAVCAIQGSAWAIDNPGGGATYPVVYAVGYFRPFNDYNATEAALWVDDFELPMMLTNTPDSLVATANIPLATSITMKGDNVYVAGTSVNSAGSRVATVWRNGAVLAQYPGVPLPPPYYDTNSHARTITFSGADMYVLGGVYENGGETIWKNGVATKVSNLDPTSMVVTGTIAPTTYVTVNGPTYTYLRQNSIKYLLADNAYAQDVKVSGGHAYVAGHLSGSAAQKAVYWKFDTVTHSIQTQSLWDGIHDSAAAAIAVSGSNVYVAGWEYDNTGYPAAKIWINGVGQTLGGGAGLYAYAQTIFIDGTDVYVGGSLAESPAVWKNGVLHMHGSGVEGGVGALYVKRVPY